jgi:hypothetical protein
MSPLGRPGNRAQLGKRVRFPAICVDIERAPDIGMLDLDGLRVRLAQDEFADVASLSYVLLG